jgi:hypothetical protein
MDALSRARIEVDSPSAGLVGSKGLGERLYNTFCCVLCCSVYVKTMRRV